MPRTVRNICLALACLAGAADLAQAQAPKPGREWYEDAVDLGFKFKAPDGWSFVPAQPDDVGLVGKYVSPSSQFLVDPKTGRAWDYTLWIVAFDRRPAAEGEEEPIRGAENLPEWVEAVMPVNMRKTDEDKGRNKKIDTIEYIFEGVLGSEYEVGLFARLYKLRPDVDVALVFNGPGGRNWKKFERAFKKIGDSLLPLEVAEREAASGPMSVRERKRSELMADVAKQPGWELYETGNYFIVSNNTDREFLEELMDRLEAIRRVYEETYPPAKALELKRAAAAKKREAEESEKEPEDEAQDPAAEGRTVAEKADPMELSRTSVVRVCNDRDEYVSYGGPPGSAGYWHPLHKELVVYDDKAVGGRGDTWATLNHEAFHQYIFYFFGNLAPHSWYNEGTGDFYSGYEYKNRRFTLKPFDWRHRLIQGLVRDEKHVPLKDLVRFTKSEYYGDNKYGTGGGENYAQGWALVWFLRTGPKNARCWKDEWTPILDTYLRVLVETDDLDKAVDEAFAAVDWEEFEECWKQYTLQS